MDERNNTFEGGGEWSEGASRNKRAEDMFAAVEEICGRCEERDLADFDVIEHAIVGTRIGVELIAVNEDGSLQIHVGLRFPQERGGYGIHSFADLQQVVAKMYEFISAMQKEGWGTEQSVSMDGILDSIFVKNVEVSDVSVVLERVREAAQSTAREVLELMRKRQGDRGGAMAEGFGAFEEGS